MAVVSKMVSKVSKVSSKTWGAYSFPFRLHNRLKSQYLQLSVQRSVEVRGKNKKWSKI
jgi:Neuraminidase (sialidase)